MSKTIHLYGRNCRQAIIIVAMLAAIGPPILAASKTFTVATGMIDNCMDKTAPTSNYSTYSIIWMTPIVADSGFAMFAHIGDPSIDDTLSTLGAIVVDSAFLIYTRDRIYYSTGDSIFLWPVGVMGGRNWIEAQETWTRWKTGSNWTTAGGDTTSIIAKIDTLSTHTADVCDTIIPRRGVLGGTAWLDSSKTSSGNTGVIFCSRENQVGSDNKVGQIDIYSTEDATDSNRPVIIYFYTAAGGAATLPPRRRR
jgi:hypothetical protein